MRAWSECALATRSHVRQARSNASCSVHNLKILREVKSERAPGSTIADAGDPGHRSVSPMRTPPSSESHRHSNRPVILAIWHEPECHHTDKASAMGFRRENMQNSRLRAETVDLRRKLGDLRTVSFPSSSLRCFEVRAGRPEYLYHFEVRTAAPSPPFTASSSPVSRLQPPYQRYLFAS